jgi:hypothetical protein
MADTGTVPTTKTELLAYTRSRWRAVAELTDSLADADWVGPTDAAGWTVKDHVAHVVSWTRAEIALLRHGTPLSQSQGIPDALWRTGDFDQMNALVRQQMLSDAPAVVRAERDHVFRKLMAVVGEYSDGDLARAATEFGFEEPGQTLLAVLIAYHGDHFSEHRGAIERILAGA